MQFAITDTHFVRDGKPFSMGDETWADGIFPPPPSVFYGALRSTWLGSNPDAFATLTPAHDPTAALQITRLALADGADVLMPLPRDCVKISGAAEKTVFTLPAVENAFPSGAQLPYRFAAAPDQRVESPSLFYIKLRELKTYLETGSLKTDIWRDLGAEVITEPKTGIGRDNATRTASEGKLYRVGMKRFTSRELTFVASVNGLQIETGTTIRFGAEGKTAHLKPFDFPDIPLAKGISGHYLKLYLATPALFRNGSLPDVHAHPLFAGYDVRVVAAATGKSTPCGGFDMLTKSPKPMRRSVPAGSVYLLKVSGDAAALAEKVHGRSVSDYLGNEGFGIAFCGAVNL